MEHYKAGVDKGPKPSLNIMWHGRRYNKGMCGLKW